MNIFEKILTCRSLIIIGYWAEEALETAVNEEDRRALKAIMNTNQLDEAWAQAHDRLGQHAEAQKLRDWLERKAQERKSR